MFVCKFPLPLADISIPSKLILILAFTSAQMTPPPSPPPPKKNCVMADSHSIGIYWSLVLNLYLANSAADLYTPDHFDRSHHSRTFLMASVNAF